MVDEQFVTLIDGSEFQPGCVLYRHESKVMADHMERSQVMKWRGALAAEFADWWARAAS